MQSIDDIKLKTEKWLSVNSNIKLLNKLAFLLIIAAYFLPGGISDFLFWTAILIAVFLTYLNYKLK
ncbi:MAG: hypothetical protein JL56_11525 [Desulfotomaculum sp. BICA1-6]|nr:MAG: hypothetical protein JL56_11525 [Desulfotomaculum sp. BICA1-6]